MKYNKETIYEGLKSHFGFETFKGTQEKIITSLLDGKDTSLFYVFILSQKYVHYFMTAFFYYRQLVWAISMFGNVYENSCKQL